MGRFLREASLRRTPLSGASHRALGSPLEHVACGLEERGADPNRNPDGLAGNFSSWLTASNKRVDIIMGDELSSLPNDGRIATEKSGHIFLIVLDRPMPVEEVAVDTVITVNQHFD